MRVRLVAVMLMAATAAFAGQRRAEEQKSDPPAQAKKQAAPANKPPSPPPGAVEIEPGLWRHTDDKGKVWLYRRTPFGLAKYEPESGETAAAEDEPELSAIEDGDNVRFERQTPFGVRRWVRKKSELTGAELAAWKKAASRVKQTPEPAPKPTP